MKASVVDVHICITNGKRLADGRVQQNYGQPISPIQKLRTTLVMR